jgi:sulfatase modifying factor 1
MGDACCAPGRKDGSVGTGETTPGSGTVPSDPGTVPSGAGTHPGAMVTVPAGRYRTGDESEWSYPGDGEGPVHDVELPEFRIDRCAVTNAQFSAFVDASGRQTDAERFGWSFVFGGLLPDEFPPTRGVEGAPWWRQVMGADWRHPEGPHSDVADRPDHPVVHVSWGDAAAYCAWSGTRLPTEAEWEVAARGGLEGQPFPWGDELEPFGEHRMNVFQGEFPGGDTGADGHRGTAPVDAFPANGYGLANMTGNVWEWCADWLGVEYYASSPVVSPAGPTCATPRTAAATGCRPGSGVRPTARPATWGSGWPPTPGQGDIARTG